MLVLTRKTNEEIVIGDNIRITIVEVSQGRVKIGIAAPKSVRVDRAEIHQQKQAAVGPPAPTPTTPTTPPAPPTNRLTDVLPHAADVPTVLPAPEPHALQNRLNALRRPLPKKPR